MAIPVMQTGTLVLALDLSGTFVFASSGAMAAIRHRLDLFGVLVVSFAAGNVGRVCRLLLGAVVPPGIGDPRCIVAPVAAGLAAFYWGSLIDRLRSCVLIFDAGGLAPFAVSGATRALDVGAGRPRCSAR
jgi:uncharacterized membrane protein YeiH